MDEQNLQVEESILRSVKGKIGASKDRNVFDADIIDFINSTLLPLSQVGVEKDGFMVTSDKEKWTDFMPAGKLLSYIIPYVFLSAKLLFDPPASSIAITSTKQMIDRYENRINFEVDVIQKMKKEDSTNEQ